MATLTIRNLDADVVERLKQRARDNHRSLEAEARVILSSAAPLSRTDAIAAIQALQRKLGKYGPFEEDSTDMIRAFRDGSRD